MAACSSFIPNQWKKDQCSECSKAKEKHVIDQTTTLELKVSLPVDKTISSEEQATDVSAVQSSSSDEEPSIKQKPCKYGMDCYRKNPYHFKHYSHPSKLKTKESATVAEPSVVSTVQQQKTTEMHVELVEKQFLASIAALENKNEYYEQEIKKLREDSEKMAKHHEHLLNALAQELNHRDRLEIEKERILAIPRSTPSYWGTNAFEEPYREIDIRQGSSEFDIINDLLNSTIETHDNNFGTIYGKDPTEFIVTKITRIHNNKLWHEYCFKKENIIQKNNNTVVNCRSSKYLKTRPILTPLLDASANEYWLFHGCREKILPTMLHSGYDPRVSDLEGMFGGGFYLAENSSKSNQYIPCTNCGKNSIFSGSGCRCKRQENLEFTIILYRAVLGDIHVAQKYDKEIYCRGPNSSRVRRPPLKTNSDDLYDSVMGESTKYGGDRLRYREFILYEPGQAYPEYVIKFKRSAVNARAPSDGKRVMRKCYNFLKNTFKLRPE